MESESVCGLLPFVAVFSLVESSLHHQESFQSTALTALPSALFPWWLSAARCDLETLHALTGEFGGQIVTPKQGVAEEPAAGLLPSFSTYEKSGLIQEHVPESQNVPSAQDQCQPQHCWRFIPGNPLLCRAVCALEEV